MNPLKKIYCRIFQTAFRIALPFLPYREPEILEQMYDVGPLFYRLHVNTVLLVTDPFLRSSGSTRELEEHLADTGIRCIVYDKTNANPTVKNIEEARELYEKENCEALIAFGGVGESGMGSYHGKIGFETFSHVKSIVDKKTWMDLPMRYQPYQRLLYGKLLRFFLK